MRVFDFDNTIYDGESVFDFYLYSIKIKPVVVKYIPLVVFNLFKYKLGKTTMEDLENAVKKYAYDYLSLFENPDQLVSDFWDKHMHKIKKWYSPQPEDIIMTASFNVMMDEICRRMGVKNCICSVVNVDTLEIEYLNFSENKRKTFEQRFGNELIEEFYTDNMLDKPMIDISQSAFLVKGNRIKKIK